jgi:penicillin-binding protein 1A
MPAHLSFSLGAGETTLYKMVAAYGMFANGGRRVEPTLVDRIQGRRGETIYRHDQRVCEECVAEDKAQVEPWPVPVARRIMDRVTAYQLVSMMEGVASRGTAARLSSLGVPVAGKTGTTNDGKDAWFVGFTPNLVAGCFVGYDNPRPMGKGGTGGGMCAPIFEDFMRDALTIRPAGTFRAPPEIVYATVDRSTGERLPDGSGGNTIREAFREGQAPELYERAAVIGGDGTTDSFFGGGDLPMSLGGEDDDDGVDNAGVSDQPPERPRPSGGGDDGDLDGGLY